jgi:hypothetical protein
MLFQLSYSSVASGLFLVLAWFHLVTIITVEVRLSAATLFLFRSRFVTLPAIALSADTENDNCFARQDVVVEEPARRNSFSEVLHRDDSSPPPVPPLPLDYSVKGTGESRGWSTKRGLTELICRRQFRRGARLEAAQLLRHPGPVGGAGHVGLEPVKQQAEQGGAADSATGPVETVKRLVCRSSSLTKTKFVGLYQLTSN